MDKDIYWAYVYGAHGKRTSKYYYVFRQDPVPHVHKIRGGRLFRCFKTFSEIRQSFIAEVDGIKWRSRRNKHMLPDAWDDYLVCNWKNKSWK